VGEQLREVAVVRADDEALGREVQPPDREDAGFAVVTTPVGLLTSQ